MNLEKFTYLGAYVLAFKVEDIKSYSVLTATKLMAEVQATNLKPLFLYTLNSIGTVGSIYEKKFSQEPIIKNSICQESENQ